jgi:D-sedoheptulose 7-phosphate isomerase
MNHFLSELLTRYPTLNDCREEIEAAAQMMLETYRRGGKILVCGNGGSCSDSDHIVGELMKEFLGKRKMPLAEQARFRDALGADAEDLIEKLQCGIPAISLPAQSAILSAFANDVDAELVYAQLVFGYAKAEDLLIGLSTSGNSKNVVCAAKVAKATGMHSLALTGAKESALSAICDCTIRVPETETFKVQELHLPVYHYLCAWVESEIFGCERH